MTPIKTVALIAHDNCKQALVDWVTLHRKTLEHCHFVTTGTTGKLIEAATGMAVERVQSGPLGGDQQIGARIAEGKIDLLIFFWDPLEPMPHDPDIKALLRLASLWNIPTACNQASADFIVHSPLMQNYDRPTPDFTSYQNRKV